MTAGKVFAGHPVDVASGVEFTAAHDIEVDGVVPLVFRRAYSTAFLDRPPTSLGLGWTHHFDATLIRDLGGFEFEGHNGEKVTFDDIHGTFDASPNGSILNVGESMELRKEANRLVVYHWHGIDDPVQKYIFDRSQGEKMQLKARELPSGHGLRVGYDEIGRVSTVTQSTEGRRLYFTYDRNTGLLAELHLGNAKQNETLKRLVARYVYDDRRRLVAVRDALGQAQEYGYDDAGRLILEKGRSGGIYRMKYDDRGRCIETSGEGGYKKREFVYNEKSHITNVKDSLGNFTSYTLNERGQVIKKVLADGSISTTKYDDYGRIVEETEPYAMGARKEYDERGNVKKKIHPNGGEQHYEYDEFHQLVKAIDPDGAIWQMRYERGALVERVDPAGRSVRFTRNQNNDLVAATGPSGNTIAIENDDGFTSESITDAYGLISSRKLDLFLNPLEVSDAKGVVGRFGYDPLGRVIESTLADGAKRRYEYEPEDELTRLIDARGNTQAAKYSVFGDCLQQTDQLQRAHHYEWDTEGRLVSIRNPKGELARIEYDLVGNIVRIEHFDGSIERFDYDLAQRMIRRYRPDGTRLDFSYDSLGNVTGIKADEQELRSIKYDLCGAPLEAATPHGKVVFEYEPGGLIKAEIQNGRRVEYAYDEQGCLAKRDFAGSKAGVLRFEHDGRGRMVSFRADCSDGQAHLYNAANQLVERDFGKVREVLDFDLVGRLNKQQVASKDARWSRIRSYEYDAEGALVGMVDNARGRHCKFEYDAAEQLVGSTVQKSIGLKFVTERAAYACDENGNLREWDWVKGNYEKGDRIIRKGDIEFKRDANGNIVSRKQGGSETRYVWNALGELSRVVYSDESETKFGYDAFGRRVFKEHRGQRTDYFWSGNDLLAEQTAEHVTEYAIWGAWPEALWEDGEIRHVMTLHHGAPVELVDRNGRVVWKAEYDDWGKVTWEEGVEGASCRLRLMGQIADSETGLHYNRFRYYSPEIGQFISPDPVGEAWGHNRFRYAPSIWNWTDLYGLKCGSCGTKKGPSRTKPTLPKTIIARQGEIRIEHYYHGQDHGPAHAHVVGGGPKTKIGPLGYPIAGQPALSPAQQAVVNANRPQIRSAINKLGRWLAHRKWEQQQ